LREGKTHTPHAVDRSRQQHAQRRRHDSDAHALVRIPQSWPARLGPAMHRHHMAENRRVCSDTHAPQLL